MNVASSEAVWHYEKYPYSHVKENATASNPRSLLEFGTQTTFKQGVSVFTLKFLHPPLTPMSGSPVTRVHKQVTVTSTLPFYIWPLLVYSGDRTNKVFVLLSSSEARIFFNRTCLLGDWGAESLNWGQAWRGKCNYKGEMGIQATDALIGHRLVLLTSSFLEARLCFVFRTGVARNSYGEGWLFLSLAGLNKTHTLNKNERFWLKLWPSFWRFGIKDTHTHIHTHGT